MLDRCQFDAGDMDKIRFKKIRFIESEQIMIVLNRLRGQPDIIDPLSVLLSFGAQFSGDLSKNNTGMYGEWQRWFGHQAFNRYPDARI